MKGQDDDAGEDAAENEVLLDGFKGGLDEAGLVAGVGDFEVRREGGFEFVQAVFDVGDDIEGVGAGLFADGEDDGGGAVETGGGAGFFVAVDDLGDVADADGGAVEIADDDAFKIEGAFHAAEGAEREFAIALIDAAAGDFDVLGA